MQREQMVDGLGWAEINECLRQALQSEVMERQHTWRAWLLFSGSSRL